MLLNCILPASNHWQHQHHQNVHVQMVPSQLLEVLLLAAHHSNLHMWEFFNLISHSSKRLIVTKKAELEVQTLLVLQYAMMPSTDWSSMYCGSCELITFDKSVKDYLVLLFHFVRCGSQKISTLVEPMSVGLAEYAEYFRSQTWTISGSEVHMLQNYVLNTQCLYVLLATIHFNDISETPSMNGEEAFFF